jgi:putative hemolysin
MTTAAAFGHIYSDLLWTTGPRRTTFAGVSNDKYVVRFARDEREIESALKLRHDVFNIELGGPTADADSDLEFDSYDLRSLHLIVICRRTGETVGTYRLNSIETVGSTAGFYSSNEFTTEDLPHEILSHGVEIGRACIAREHRNTQVLFLLWKALIAYLAHEDKRYFFGCCSIFTQDEKTARDAYRRIVRDGHLDEHIAVLPCRNAVGFAGDHTGDNEVQLPALFNMYLRIGAKVCGPPMIDREFGTIDFFVVFDSERLNEKYRRMFS